MNVAEALARLKGVRPCAGGHVACCPAHDDQHPSLSIREAENGEALFRCFAGCSNHAIITALGDPSCTTSNLPCKSQNPTAALNDAKRTEYAQRVWRDDRSAVGTVVEVYLRIRGVTMPVPRSLRFHSNLRHPTGAIFPAMVAAIQNRDGQVVAIHRTFLNSDGSGKANVEPQKMTLGRMRGSVVRLANTEETICLTEGIETGLSIQQSTGIATWAALGTSNICCVELPGHVRELIIAADYDLPGLRAAIMARDHFIRRHLRVQLIVPERGDFNDVLVNKYGMTKGTL
jgi:putative DNA primase/helicase